MKFSKDKNNLIIKIPLWQSGKHTYGKGKWVEQNFMFVKTWDKAFNDWSYTISNANYLDYKDDLQEGMPIIYLSEEEFNKARKIIGFPISKEHQRCYRCGNPIYGCFTYDKNGKEIYEGDVVKYGDKFFEVCWNQLHCAWGLFLEGGQSEYMLADWIKDDGSVPKRWENAGYKIIGNIYENKNLLPKKQ